MSFWYRQAQIRKYNHSHDEHGRFASANASGEVALEILSKAKAAEPKVSEDLKSALPDHAYLEGFNKRLKSQDSLTEKIDKYMKDGDIKTVAEAKTQVRDALRYTAILPEGTYKTGIESMLASLKAEGYSILSVRNTWGNPIYQGVNTNVTAPNGQVVELQFHTTDSFKTKTLNHGLYEEVRKPGVSEADAADANAKMEANQKKLKVPAGILDYKHE